MLRTIIKPDAPRINLSIPSEYVGEEVEILIFPVNDTEKKHSSREEAFQNFMKYKGSLPADFDYKKEMETYRNERYGHIN